MGDSWIVSNLNAALTTWNDKLGEIWQLLTQSPQTFKDGQVWAVMVGIHGALQAIGYRAAGALLRSRCGQDLWNLRGGQTPPNRTLKLFIRFALARGCCDLWPGSDAGHLSDRAGDGLHGDQPIRRIRNECGYTAQELIDAINEVGFWDSIPLWAVTLIGGLLITVLSFVMILTVYRPDVFPLDVCGHCAHSAFVLCRRTHVQCGQELPAQLCRCLPAGRSHRLGLHHLLRRVFQPAPLWIPASR